MTTPRIEINLNKIQANTRFLVEFFGSKGINLMGITKVMLGNPAVARAMLAAGVRYIGDSRIENIIRMKKSGLQAEFVLVRTPLLSQAGLIVQYADISLNTELPVLSRLSALAEARKTTHRVVLMVELGDLREGICPSDLPEMVRAVRHLPGLQIAGIGTTLGCFGGIFPDHEKMVALCTLAQAIEQRFGLALEIVSGGTSLTYDWVCRQKDTATINNLRIGEMIVLGWNVLTHNPIRGLHTDAVTLVTEVIETGRKPSVPNGQIKRNAFGEIPVFTDRGPIRRAILGIGRQDVGVSGLHPIDDVEILGASSDHLVVYTKNKRYRPGDEIRFRLDYGALLRAMTSPYIVKTLIGNDHS